MKKRIFHLDPRTKLLLLILEAVIILGGAGTGSIMAYFRYSLIALPFLLLLSERLYLKFIIGCAVFGVGFLAQTADVSGGAKILMLMISSILLRFVPSLLMGSYVVRTTTVSEFTAAMQKLHVTDKLTIPMSVMFRFFPTVGEEFISINKAMKMRGIRFGTRFAEAIEYRIVPMLTCSVKIGEELSAAALTRGLGSPRKRTSICRLRFGAADILLMLFGAACIVFLILETLGVTD